MIVLWQVRINWKSVQIVFLTLEEHLKHGFQRKNKFVWIWYLALLIMSVDFTVLMTDNVLNNFFYLLRTSPWGTHFWIMTLSGLLGNSSFSNFHNILYGSSLKVSMKSCRSSSFIKALFTLEPKLKYIAPLEALSKKFEMS